MALFDNKSTEDGTVFTYDSNNVITGTVINKGPDQLGHLFDFETLHCWRVPKYADPGMFKVVVLFLTFCVLEANPKNYRFFTRGPITLARGLPDWEKRHFSP